MEGCDVGTIFSVPNSMIPKARKTGNFTLLPNRLARELLVDTEGKVRAVSVVDTGTCHEEEIRARFFAVCCATIESARLLLSSRSTRYPNGLANSNDVVGRYLHGHNTADIFAYLEDLVGTRPVNNDGATDHSYIPRFNTGGKKRDYAGRYHYELQDYSFMTPYHAHYLKGFGKKFKEQVRVLQPGFMAMDWYAKVLARPENRVTVDLKRVDAHGPSGGLRPSFVSWRGRRHPRSGRIGDRPPNGLAEIMNLRRGEISYPWNFIPNCIARGSVWTFVISPN